LFRVSTSKNVAGVAPCRKSGGAGASVANGAGPATATGGPLNYATIKPYGATLSGTIKIAVPAMSVIYLVADHK